MFNVSRICDNSCLMSHGSVIKRLTDGGEHGSERIWIFASGRKAQVQHVTGNASTLPCHLFWFIGRILGKHLVPAVIASFTFVGDR